MSCAKSFLKGERHVFSQMAGGGGEEGGEGGGEEGGEEGGEGGEGGGGKGEHGQKRRLLEWPVEQAGLNEPGDM